MLKIRNKKWLIAILVLFAAVILTAVFYLCFHSAKIEPEGYLLLRSPNHDGSLVLLNASTGQVEPTGAYGLQACFAGSSDKFLIYSFDLLECFDEKTGSDVWTCEIPGNPSWLGFVYAGSSFVSTVVSDQLQLINMDTDERTIIREDEGLGPMHDWSADGKTVYYSVFDFDVQSEKIYKYNVDSCEEAYLFEGSSPSVSADGSRIAFSRNSALVVKDLVTGKEWTYHKFPRYVKEYCISPDGKYVAIVTEQFPNFLADTVLIWDFASNQTFALLKDYPSGHCYDLDWMQ